MGRIFVGGLGESVTADDIRKTFSSLGMVKAIDMVRTNGRSFGYMDFQPNSDKALAKLFSMYNGCIWKGGKLRLEKAKEHYLTRLRREWEEDAELASQTPNNDFDAGKLMDSSEKPNKFLTQEKMQLRIFFPRFRKVKSLPYGGTGKHKYSFQRTEVPSLPVHFCDCEEHCGPETERGKQVSPPEAEKSVIDEEELNMMSSVMNKLFARDSTAKIDQSTDDVHCNEIEIETQIDQTEDADNLVTNMVTGGNSRSGLIRTSGLGATFKHQAFGKTQIFNAGPTEGKPTTRKRKDTGPSNPADPIIEKRPCLQPEKESDKNEVASTKPEKKGRLESHSKESKRFTETQSPQNFSWVQKSSWKSLVGETVNSSFSISHILPKSNFSDSLNSIDSKEQNLVNQVRNESTVDSSKDLLVGKPEVPKNEVIGLVDFDVVASEKEEQIEHSTSEKSPQDIKCDLFIEPLDVKNDSESEKISAKSTEKEGDSETHSKEEGFTEAQPIKPKEDALQKARGLSWIKKSSWRELVNETSNNSFSISNILSGIDYTKQEELNSKCPEATSSNEVGNVKVTDVIATIEEEQVRDGLEVENLISENKAQYVEDDDNVVNEAPREMKKTSMGTIRIGEFCSFMRSSASEKEWLKTKTALSGSLKKKTGEK